MQNAKCRMQNCGRNVPIRSILPSFLKEHRAVNGKGQLYSFITLAVYG